MRRSLNRICILLVLFLGSVVRAEEVLKLSAGASVQESLLNKTLADFQKDTGIRIEITKSSRKLPTEYFKDLLEGRSDGALASLSYEDWLKAMQEEKLLVPEGITQRVVGRDFMSVIAATTAGIKGLDLPQVVGILAGKRTNWKEFGGPDLPIVVLTSKDRSPTYIVFERIFMKGASIKRDGRVFETFAELVQQMPSIAGAVGLSTIVIDNPGIMKIKTPPLGRSLGSYSKSNTS